MHKSLGVDWEDVLVVFTDNAAHWYLRFLKRGFRHCFVVLGNGQEWVLLEHLFSSTEISLIKFFTKEELRNIFISKGHIVIEGSFFPRPVSARKIGIFTCVESIKRVLGIKSMNLATPYQLYKFLKKEKNRKKSVDIGINSCYSDF